MPGDEEAAEAEKLKMQEEMLAAYEDEKERRLDQLVQVEIEYLSPPIIPLPVPRVGKTWLKIVSNLFQRAEDSIMV